MTAANSILVVDDEPAFLESTAELLRRDGYECDCAAAAAEAVAKLGQRRYDVVISDIRMPNNPDLLVVREAHRLARGTPVILVTAYPTVDTAVSAIELPVVAYLQKPLDHADLREHVEASIARSESYRAVSRVRELLEESVVDLKRVEEAGREPKGTDGHAGAAIPVRTLRTLSECLTQLVKLDTEAAPHGSRVRLCELLECPQWRLHRGALVDAVAVLKETRRRFRSKELANLRSRLESHLDDREDDTSASQPDASPPSS